MNLTRSFNNWRKYRQTVTELGRMSSRELHDLGIDRADIHRVAREATGRKSPDRLRPTARAFSTPVADHRDGRSFCARFATQHRSALLKLFALCTAYKI